MRSHMTDTTRLKDKVVIVTGGGSGIGKGACLRIAAEGAKIAILDIRQEIAEAVASEIKSAGGDAIALKCNVAVEDEVAAAVATKPGRCGRLARYAPGKSRSTARVGRRPPHPARPHPNPRHPGPGPPQPGPSQPHPVHRRAATTAVGRRAGQRTTGHHLGP